MPTPVVPTPTPAPPPAALQVIIQGFGYQPQSIEIEAGTTVTWTNRDPVQHDADDREGSWDGPLLDEGGTWSRTFPAAGAFLVTCSIHPYMQSLVTVR